MNTAQNKRKETEYLHTRYIEAFFGTTDKRIKYTLSFDMFHDGILTGEYATQRMELRWLLINNNIF